MKIFSPPKRLVELDFVLRYDSEERRMLKIHERFAINQERAKILGGNESYRQSEMLEEKITKILADIEYTGWEPYNPIEYVINY